MGQAVAVKTEKVVATVAQSDWHAGREMEACCVELERREGHAVFEHMGLGNRLMACARFSFKGGWFWGRWVGWR